MTNKRFDFSPDEFKHWVSRDISDEALGGIVESVVPAKKLYNKMIVEDGDAKELALDFKNNGGKIIQVRDKDFLIEVAAGSFYISKNYVITRDAT